MMRAAPFFRILILLLAVSACADRSFTPVLPGAKAIGTTKTIFVGTTRAQEPNGTFGFDRSDRLRHLELTVSIPPTHQPGQLKFGYANPDPRRQFALAGQTTLDNEKALQTRLRQALSRLAPSERDITVFVHGFNATQNETAFRAAQLAHDIRLPGEVVVYSWPSRGKALAYAYDGDSMLFARDGLEQLLRQIKGVGARQVVLVAHSMGSALVMETLRQMELTSPGSAHRDLSGVILISPDLDVQVFRSQFSRLSRAPEPFVLFVSRKDKVLNLSARLRGTAKQSRLGNLENAELVSDLPVTVVDATEFSDTAGSSHFVPATSPALIAMMLQANKVNTTFRREAITLTSLLTGRPETGTGVPLETLLKRVDER